MDGLNLLQNPVWRGICRRKWIELILMLLCLLQPAAAAHAKTAADYYIPSLPGAPAEPRLKMHAGHIEVSPDINGNLFFWHFQNRHIGDKQRTVIWLNGGPGCSSMDGALMEVGPYRVRENGKLAMNNGSWDEFANLLFVDQPFGTGFSYVDTNSYLKELDEMSSAFVTFLEKFFALFPDYVEDDIYIAGESYAGQHIPYIADAILKHNEKASNIKQWNLKGLLIGNGWISPTDQYPAYLQFAFAEGMISADSQEARDVEKQQTTCQTELDADGKNHVDTGSCEGILSKLLSVTQDPSKPKDQVCTNMYDIRLRDDSNSCGMNWPPDLKDVTPYLRRDDVIYALHIDRANQAKWTECNGAVSSAFQAPTSKPSIQMLPDLLESVPILLFSGDKDLICNHVGTENLIKRMEWNGGKGFELSPGVWAPKRPWTFEKEPAGTYQSARNLTYVRFYNSSHMVPFDFPRRTRDMLDRFMGVDIASTGGEPKDSKIDGEKAGPETSVGGHPNSTVAEQEAEGKLKEAEYKAYYKSGEVALVIVILLAGAWGWWIWRERSRRRRAGYAGVAGDEDYGPGPGPSDVLNGVRHAAASGLGLAKSSGPGPGPTGRTGWVREGWNFGGLGGSKHGSSRADLEAADFDEAELDEYSPMKERHNHHRGESEKFDDLVSSDDERGEGDSGESSSSAPTGGKKNRKP